MAKEKLFVEHSLDDYLLFGIISDVKEYKLAWQINKFLDIRLEMKDDFSIDFKNKSIVIVYYEYLEEYQSYRLIKNQAVETKGAKNAFLIPEMKNYPYLLLINSEKLDEIDTTSILSQLSSSPDVQYVNKIELDNIESVDNLIF
jgi:hypothetical protein